MKLVVGATHTPSLHFSSCSDPVEQGTPEESTCKNQENWKVWLVVIMTRVMSLCSTAWNNRVWVISWVMYLKISLWKYLGWSIYIFSKLDIFTMIFLGMWPISPCHKVLSHGCILQSSLPDSNWAWLQVFWVFTATFTLVEPTQPD